MFHPFKFIMKFNIDKHNKLSARSKLMKINHINFDCSTASRQYANCNVNTAIMGETTTSTTSYFKCVIDT